jgi:hypothetical protein
VPAVAEVAAVIAVAIDLLVINIVCLMLKTI